MKCAKRHYSGVLWIAALLSGCGNVDPQTVHVDFRQSSQGWTAGFADYPVGQDDFYELEADYRSLSAPLDSSQNGHFLSGNNHSDDLWMFIKGRVSGLDANHTYSVQFEVEIATRAPSGCVGVGGAPGEGVSVKAGASVTEPEAVMTGTDWRMNVDKGNQSTGGANALVVGDMANSVRCGEPPRWELEQLSSGSESITVTADSDGRVWLFAGTDSGFEATTRFYFTWIIANFEP